jgi:hypothetical protein
MRCSFVEAGVSAAWFDGVIFSWFAVVRVPRRHPHHPLAAGEQEALERDRDLPAILQRPRPREQLLLAPAARLQSPLAAQLTRHLVAAGGGVTLLVRVNSEAGFRQHWRSWPSVS